MLRQVSFCSLLLKIALVFCSVWLGCALWTRVATDPCSNCGCWSPGCHRVSPHFHPLTPCGCVSGFSEAGLSGKLCFGQHLLTPCLGIWPLVRSVLWDMPRFPLRLSAAWLVGVPRALTVLSPRRRGLFLPFSRGLMSYRVCSFL